MKTWNHYEFTVMNEQGQMVHRLGRIANYDCRKSLNDDLQQQFPGCLIICIVTPYEMKKK